jgi:ferredoxin
MNRKAELADLRFRVGNIQARLQSLINQLMEIEQVVCPAPLQAFADKSRCTGCGTCQDACPAGAIAIDKTAYVDPSRCIGCGRCIDECPQGALSLCPICSGKGGSKRIELYPLALYDP